MKKELKHSDYVTDIRFSVSQVKLMFKLRTRMFPVKENFKNKFKDKDMNCDICKIELCTQSHLLKCEILKKFVPSLIDTNIIYEDIFDDTDKQYKFIKLYSEVNEKREILLEALKVVI